MLFVLGIFVLCIVVCLVALVLGGTPERIAAAIILAIVTVGTVINHTFRNPVLDLTIDGLVAAVFLLMSLRYASVWLGGVMLIFALQFTLHAFYLVTERPKDTLHAVINNANVAAITICLAAGVLSARRRRQTVAA